MFATAGRLTCAAQTNQRRGAGGSEAVPAAKTNERTLAAERAFAAASRLRAQWRADSAREAARKYEEAARHWATAGDRPGETKALKGLGDALKLAGETQKSLGAYERALALSREAGDRLAEGEVRTGLCYLHLSVGDNQRALDECTIALELSHAARSMRVEAEALNGLGEAYYSRDELQKAVEFYSRALALWRELRDDRGQAQTFTYLGYAHATLNETPKAFEFYTQALALWRATDDLRGQIQTLTAMGFLNSKIGETQESLNLYYQAMRLSKQARYPDLEGPLLSGIGYAYNDLGEKRQSLIYYEQALSVYKLLEDSWGEAAIRLIIGMVYQALADDERALSNYRKALATYRAMGRTYSVSHVLREIGRVYDKRGDYTEALKYYDESLQLTQPEKDPREAAYTLNYIGRIHERTGAKQKALEYYDRALSLNSASGDRSGEALTLYSLANAQHGLGNYDSARAYIEKTLKISETLRAKVASNDLRASYFASTHQQFELYTDILMRLHEKLPTGGFDVVAFEVSERGRARSLLETLSEARADIRRGVDEKLLRSEQDLLRRINAKVEQRVRLPLLKATQEELAAVEKELEALTTEYQQVQAQIRASSPRYAALVQPSPLTLTQIQQSVLDADTVLLEYLLGDERSFVWVVTPDSLKHFSLPPRAEIERAVRRVYELLTARNQTVKGETEGRRRARLADAEAEYTQAAGALSRMILGPVAGELGSKRIVIVADGALQYVPFAALPDPSAAADSAGAGAPPLVIGHEVLNLPSASVLALMREELRGRPSASKAVAVLADPVFDRDDERLRSAAVAKFSGSATDARAKATRSASKQEPNTAAPRTLRSFDESGGGGLARLPFSRREARAIMDVVLEGKGFLALDFRASHATATSGELANYRVVHFATHALLNSEHPELSGIVLSLFDEGGRDQEGFLELNEIYNLDLPVDLVVLSACQTALGKEVRGEGLVGLTRGFMYAGAARVIASLWRVDDSATAELMGEFYRRMLGEGLRPAAALRAAQIHMWQQNRWRSPYFWAAFTLQGEWN